MERMGDGMGRGHFTPRVDHVAMRSQVSKNFSQATYSTTRLALVRVRCRSLVWRADDGPKKNEGSVQTWRGHG